ncbi:PhzF family phenazine biosynthesis protein [Thorsellia anophelis]|uniref:Phenazine biosynthesis protein PhzF family n=1 Tax=Thorsellia anophelis DSM 18579 TaxID=1123402 RepID=A0A1I0ER52_9GAMM|nr:PhzF family phenazine biosynthesis protein [Thorsellia anophelis]SET47068.1 phenazine biosynthesis protein PhzF family [Thorsellia anophelis DSM 18579]
MRHYRYQILNVFTQDDFSGNPLCVFESSVDLDQNTMQKLAKQFNLSETVFLTPFKQEATSSNLQPVTIDYSMRIFTPSYELPFAGHPVIGSSVVASQLLNDKDEINFLCQSGIVTVNYDIDTNYWTLKTPDYPLSYEKLVPFELDNLKKLFNIDEFAGEPAYVNTGSEQLIVPLASKKLVDEVIININATDIWPTNKNGRKTAYLFSLDIDSNGALSIYSRFLFLSATDAAGEDPGTGSACANLGYWLFKNGFSSPINAKVTQGVKYGRTCNLSLQVSNDKEVQIFVGGSAIKVAEGRYFFK